MDVRARRTHSVAHEVCRGSFMHTRTTSIYTHKRVFGKPAPMRSKRDPTRAELEVIELLVHQVAMPLDQLARFRKCSLADAEKLALDLAGNCCAYLQEVVPNEARWIWLASPAKKFSKTDFSIIREIPLSRLDLLRAVNEVRLYVTRRAPEARWVSFRQRERGGQGFKSVPTAVVEINGERHAIEVRVFRTSKRALASLLARREEEFDAVICFCTAQQYRAVDGVLSERHMPKVRVYELSKLGDTPGDQR
jgi:hypothetical protein